MLIKPILQNSLRASVLLSVLGLMSVIELGGVAWAQTPTQTPTQAQAQLRLMGVQSNATQLVQFAAQGDLTVVKLLLQSGVPAVEAEPKRGVSALHNAAAQGHQRVVEWLLAHGANLDAQDAWGMTPLLNAAYFGRTAIVKILVERGAKLQLVSKDGMSALDCAVYSGNAEVLGLLLPHKFSNEQRQAAAQLANRAGRSAMSQMLSARP